MRGGREPVAALTKATLDETNPADATLSTNSKNKPADAAPLNPATDSTAAREPAAREPAATETETKTTESSATEVKAVESKETESKEPESKETEAKTGEATEAKTGEETEAKTGEATEAKTGEATEAKTGEATEAKTGEATEAKTGEATESAAAAANKPAARPDDTEPEPEPKKSNVEAESEADASQDKCTQGASIFNSVPAECIKKKDVALETIIKNAVNVPVELAKKETADGVIALLESSGNEAIANILMKEALPQLTGPDGKILNEVITDPAVAKEFDKFQNNLSGVVGKSLKKLSHKIEEPVNEAVETLVEGSISTATHAAANAPGVGAIVTIGEAVGTVNKLKDEATEVMDAVNDAKLPIDTAMKDIVPLSNAIDEAATKAKNAQDAATSAAASATSAAASSATDAASSATDAASSAAATSAAATSAAATSAAEGAVAGVNDATSAAATSAAATSAAATSAAATSEKNPKPVVGGGSRKRRRIAKLSRRIERTLRRVQKKYGLKDDKNSFLRRTLNAKKMK